MQISCNDSSYRTRHVFCRNVWITVAVLLIRYCAVRYIKHVKGQGKRSFLWLGIHSLCVLNDALHHFSLLLYHQISS